MPRFPFWSLLLAGGLSAPGVLASPPSPVPAAAPPGPVEPWPSAKAPLSVVPVVFPPGFGRPRIYLDAGHGAPGNEGNSSVTCEAERVYTLRVAEALARRLEATGHFRVKLSRAGERRPPYAERLAEAERWGAAVFLSLHSDARGEGVLWRPTPERECARNDGHPGYSVLYADDSAEPLRSQRLRLARALARGMGSAGFLPYGGEDYVGLYAPDPEQPGTFVSRHAPGRRIFVLRKPPMPSAIIETHHAWDFEEEARWREERTQEAFAAAVARGLVDALTGGKALQARGAE